MAIINLNPMRRKFKKKVRVTKDYGGIVKTGDILISVTMRKGNYSGLLEVDGKLIKRWCPVSYAEEIL